MAESMTGPIPFRPEGGAEENPKWEWDFKNDTGKKICDFIFYTDFGAGDPEIRHVSVVRASDGKTLYDDYPEEAREADIKHVKLSECINPGEEFTITCECDERFDEEERIEISPTSATGAVIHRPKPSPPPPSKDILELLLEILKGVLPEIIKGLLPELMVQEEQARKRSTR